MPALENIDQPDAPADVQAREACGRTDRGGSQAIAHLTPKQSHAGGGADEHSEDHGADEPQLVGGDFDNAVVIEVRRGNGNENSCQKSKDNSQNGRPSGMLVIVLHGILFIWGEFRATVSRVDSAVKARMGRAETYFCSPI